MSNHTYHSKIQEIRKKIVKGIKAGLKLIKKGIKKTREFFKKRQKRHIKNIFKKRKFKRNYKAFIQISLRKIKESPTVRWVENTLKPLTKRLPKKTYQAYKYGVQKIHQASIFSRLIILTVLFILWVVPFGLVITAAIAIFIIESQLISFKQNN